VGLDPFQNSINMEKRKQLNQWNIKTEASMQAHNNSNNETLMLHIVKESLCSGSQVKSQQP
jgi:hypothetical protein